VLITRSEQGMSLFNQQEAEHHVPAQVREVFDVTGAGDTVISLMALGLGTHGNLLQSAQISNLAAGVVVGKVGSATASQGEIIAFHRQWNDQSADSKIMSPHSLRIQLDRLREMGKKIVFTNGIFDLLHIGHIQLFQKAKALGDILVVGINSDESARLLKGEGRPIISDRERASIISAIAAVDYVTIFREATPEVVLGKLRPHILAKGANYQDVEVIGREIVREYGGEVCLIPIKEQISVSDITERIREKKES
jgi:D-beta-D-heptose 7-phosphate kinase/D-beta-D-heptose 1-phosphate adenosyltransferase